MPESRGILWLAFPDPQEEPRVNRRFSVPAEHLHVTLQFNVTESQFAEFIGRTVDVKLLRNCFNLDIQAVTVQIEDPEIAALCRNEIPHMTVSMEEGIRPVASNEMLRGSYEYRTLDSGYEAVVEFHPFGS